MQARHLLIVILVILRPFLSPDSNLNMLLRGWKSLFANAIHASTTRTHQNKQICNRRPQKVCCCMYQNPSCPTSQSSENTPQLSGHLSFWQPCLSMPLMGIYWRHNLSSARYSCHPCLHAPEALYRPAALSLCAVKADLLATVFFRDIPHRLFASLLCGDM